MSLLDGMMKGINLGGWLSQCGEKYNENHYNTFITEEDIKKISDMGLDHVRVPVDYNVVQNEDGSFIESGFKHLDDCISWCKKYNLKMVLDLHKTCGFIFDDASYCSFFTDEKLIAMFKDLWMEFTRRYGKEDCVIFELLNEVTNLEFAEPWNKISRETAVLIHSVVPEKPIIIGGVFNNSIFGVTLLGEPVDDHIIYTFHCYDPLLFTHQGAYWVPRLPADFRIKYRSPLSEIRTLSHEYFGADFDDHFTGLGDGIINADYFRKLFAPAFEVSKKYNVPLYCGEYGVIELADRESVVEWYRDINEVLTENSVPRTAWSYKEMDFDLTGEKNKDIIDELKKLF